VVDAPDPAAAAVAALARLHDGERRLAEVVGLGEAAVPALGALLASRADPVPEPRLRAARALAAIATQSARDALRYALHDSLRRRLPAPLAAAESEVISAIARGLVACGDDAPLHADVLAALEHGCHPGACTAAGLLGEVRAVPVLVRCLEDDVARPHAATALRRIGAPALPALRARLQTPSHGDSQAAARAACARLLGELEGENARGLLSGFLTDPSPAVRLACAVALAARGALAEARPALLAALDAAPAQVAHEAAVVLCGSVSGRDALLALANDPCAPCERRLAALAALSETDDARVTPLLETLVTASDEAVRTAALRALLRRGTAGDLVRGCCADPAAPVRALALEALVMTGDPAAAARGLADRDRGVRLGVAAALARTGDRRVLRRVLCGRTPAAARLRAARLWLTMRLRYSHSGQGHE
jgi:HEAT repeat protein